MKYAIVCCSDTNYTIRSTHSTLKAAIIAFHQYSAALWNDPNTNNATVKIVDEQLDCAEGYRESIHHEQEQTNEPE